MKDTTIAVIFFGWTALLGCKVAVDHQNTAIVLTSIQAAQERILRVPLDTSHILYDGLTRKYSVAKFYQDSSGSPVWLRKGKLTYQADSLITFIGNANYYGLPRQRYHSNAIRNGRQPGSSDIDMLRTELLLTDAFFLLSHDLKFGLQTLISNDYDSVTAALLRLVISDGDVNGRLESREPKYVGYQSLKLALKDLLDSLANTETDLTHFQTKIRLAAINLQRWRKEEAYMDERYAYINIPSYMLYVVESSDTVITSRVIVGTRENPTPELSSVIDCFTIYPYWHVPRKIAIKEYLPVIRQDTSFLSRNNFDVLDRDGVVLNPADIPWNKYTKDYFPVSLRQREGPENALGVIKFYFDNPYTVFLHDTNAKKLFRSNERAFSHGCIRMERAEELAHYLATGQFDRKSKLVEKYLAEKKRTVVNALQPLPIHIRYFTAEVANGNLVLYKDIYSMDEKLLDIVFQSEVIDTMMN